MKKSTLLLLLIFLINTASFSQNGTSDSIVHGEKHISYALIPIVSYNRSFGYQAGFMANAYFNINKKDTISPVSMIGTMGSYFQNKTLFAGIFNKSYFAEDTWRTMTAAFYGNINFQTYINFIEILNNNKDYLPEIPPIPQPIIDSLNLDESKIVDYNMKVAMVYFNIKRAVVPHLYIGAQASYTKTVTEFASQELLTQTEYLFGFGLASEYDNRDFVMNPTNGINIKLNTNSFLESLGSSSEYHKIDFTLNKYFHLSDKAIIMGRLYGITSFGNVPFSGQNVVGRDDMRGYSKGEHRANIVYNMQTEYRWNFYNKWGMVAFGGIGMAFDDFNGKNYSGILPSIGAGIRYKAIESRNINIGIDIAKGINDWGLYFRVGEAFTR
ncbi:MAG: BamA/TamA family outer membrane protein [Bacteroidales bacterium]|nr:BamA/TamA family outer membrane protein [Bacteroidales bacterium]